ncbi:MAG: hypothetical protein KAJ51_17940, partial [Thermoplasmata archaeon]|nr:hypothetical protein [Thermoplasmata archaeon]
RDAPLLKIKFSVTSGNVMVFNIMVDKNNTGLFGNPDMPYQRLYRDVNDNGVVDEGIDELLSESNSNGATFWFMPFGMPWVITPNNPLVLLFTVDISDSAPMGGGSGTGINITLSTNINYNPWYYAFDYEFPIESDLYSISAGTFDSVVVTGDDLMPANVFVGDDVVVQRLNLTASSNEAAIRSITVLLNGTATNMDVQWVDIYYDKNKDGLVSSSVDTFLGSAMFDSQNNATVYLLSMGVPFVVKSGIVKSILVVYSVTATATAGLTAGLHLNSSLNFTLDGNNDVVKPSGFPIDSSLATIIYQDTLVCAKDPRVNPTAVEEGERELLIMKINLSASSGTISSGSLRIGLLGTVSYTDMGYIYAVEDVNHNAKFDRDIDTLIGLGWFNVLGWSYIDLSMMGPFVVYSGINRSLLIGVDLEFSAYGKILGLDIGIGNVTVDAPDYVSPANFPLQSSLMNVIGAAHNTVIITPKDLAPANVYQAEEGVEMLKLIIAVDDGNANIIRVKIGFIGSANFQNISMAYLYWDVNKNDV